MTPTLALDMQKVHSFAFKVIGDITAQQMGTLSTVADRLGLFNALADAGPVTTTEFAARAGIHERYAREWLEQQAVTGMLETDPAVEASARRYALSAEHAEVLLDPDSLSWFAPVVQLVVGLTGPLPTLLAAFRTGEGIKWRDFGRDSREGQAGQNRPAFLSLLGREWLPATPTSTRDSPPIRRRGWPTWRAARAGPASASRAPIPKCASTASTSTRPP